MFIRAVCFRKGSAITEVLITMLLIVITMVAITPMFIMGVKTGKVSKNRTVEMQIAQAEIEKFNQEKFTNVLNYIRVKINSEDSFTAFKNSNSPFIDPKFVYVNPSNGEIREKEPDDKYGFKSVRIQRTYSYIQGTPSLLDDAIQLAVKVQISGKESGKSVAVTALLSIDKLQN